VALLFAPLLPFAFGCILAGLPNFGWAESWYRYQKDGQWHFSDSPPLATEQTQALEKIEAPNRNFLQLLWETPQYLLLRNRSYAPLEVLLPELRQQTFLLPPRSDLRVVVPRYLPQLKAEYVIGDPKAMPDDFLYQLPFEKGKSFFISQGFGGSFSHNAPESFFAVDFVMPEGTPVCMARAGTVVAASSHYTLAKTDEFYKNRGNYLVVLHADGTFALYGHLKPGSILVSVGSKVKTGACVARSGNTGFSTGPHLHFVVQRNSGMAYQSVAIDFADAQGQAQIPAAGTVLGH
jgi:murein DD-endopeptidase MepM/ murein hydrolase activator NlpD